MTGLQMKRQTAGTNVAKAVETKIGRTTVTALNEDEVPRFDMIWTMTRPTTSSSIAALDRTTPKRLVTSPLELNRVKVVPRLVEQRAAPAAKAWRGVAFAMPIKEKDKTIGMMMPVDATATESSRFDLRAAQDVESPPSKTSSKRPKYPSCIMVSCKGTDSHAAPGIPQAIPIKIWPMRPQ